MYYIAIDPGAKGAIAVLDNDGKFVEAHPCNYGVYTDVLHKFSPKDCIVFIENVHAMPGQGVTSMFSFGEGFGKIQGICLAFGHEIKKVEPRVWKKHYGISKDKDESIHLARETFPSVSLLPTPRCKKDSDGMAEALLIAKYGKDTHKGELK